MEEKTVLISCPVRDRAWILPHYLDHIYKLDYPKKLISILWVINQSTDDSEKILKEFKSKYEHEYMSIKIEKFNGSKIVPKDARTNDVRLKFSYSHLAEMRNFITSKIGNHDYLFSCDNDILCRPDTLRRLVEHDKDVISSLIFNGHLINPEKPYLYPNVLNYNEHGILEHISNWFVKNSPSLKESKVISVDCSGAVYLISNEVCRNKKIKYGWDQQGEDIFYSREVKRNGYEIWCDLSIFSFHIMSQELLNNYKNIRDSVTSLC